MFELKVKEKMKKSKEDRRNQIDNKLYHNFLKQINIPYKAYEKNNNFDYSDDDDELPTYRDNYGSPNNSDNVNTCYGTCYDYDYDNNYDNNYDDDLI